MKPKHLPIVTVILVATALMTACAPVGEGQPSPTGDSAEAPDRASMTTDELAEWQLDSSWDLVVGQYPDAKRPDVATVRYIDYNESAQVLADCMVSSGWPDVTATPDNGVESGTIPEGQGESYAVAYYVCQAMYPLDLKYLRPLTDDQKRTLFAYFRDELAPCLEEEGFEVPQAPSEQTFLETYDATGGWDVYANVAPTVSQSEWYQINEVCPQLPDDLYS